MRVATPLVNAYWLAKYILDEHVHVHSETKINRATEKKQTDSYNKHWKIPKNRRKKDIGKSNSQKNCSQPKSSLLETLLLANMEDYYRKRAQEYEEMYHLDYSIWQKELNIIANALKETLKGRMVLEIACGTGHWTQIMSETARSIIATDIAQEMLEIAKRKSYKCPTHFCREDAYNLPFENGSFDGAMAHFWLSHVPKNKIDSFMKSLHKTLKSEAKVFMSDNVYVSGIGGEFVTKEGDQNTYKLRKLKNGSEHIVLKNYYSVDELTEIISRYDDEFDTEDVFHGNYFWYLTYELR